MNRGIPPFVGVGLQKFRTSATQFALRGLESDDLSRGDSSAPNFTLPLEPLRKHNANTLAPYRAGTVKGEPLMVMRNRHEGSNTPHWWDDLPPHLRSRFSGPLLNDEKPNDEEPRKTRKEPERTPEPPSAFSRSELIIDLSRFAIVFTFISIVILLYLLVALSYVAG
jgi:hypothetical protein